MKDHLEFITQIGTSLASSSWKSKTLVLTIIFLAVRLCVKFLWFYRDRLPVFTFHYNPSRIGAAAPAPYCSVCLYEAEDGEKLRRLPRCNHCFHVDCIDAWFQYRPTCPLCRNEVSVRRKQSQRGLLSSIVLSILQNLFRKMCSRPLNFTSSLM